jgi:hypothetical protein
MNLTNLLPHLTFLPVRLDLEYNATFENDGRTEQVVEITSTDHSHTIGYLCTGDDPINAYLIHALNNFHEVAACLADVLDAEGDLNAMDFDRYRKALTTAETLTP